jgi:hypothetical protein
MIADHVAHDVSVHVAHHKLADHGSWTTAAPTPTMTTDPTSLCAHKHTPYETLSSQLMHTVKALAFASTDDPAITNVGRMSVVHDSCNPRSHGCR